MYNKVIFSEKRRRREITHSRMRRRDSLFGLHTIQKLTAFSGSFLSWDVMEVGTRAILAGQFLAFSRTLRNSRYISISGLVAAPRSRTPNSEV